MRTKVASDDIKDDPEIIAEWVRSYCAKPQVIKLKLEKKGNRWKLTVYFRE